MKEDTTLKVPNTTPTLVFNGSSGQVMSMPFDQLSLLQEYEIVLKKGPKSSCKQCYGRGHVSYDPVKQQYAICRKCARHMIDFDHARERVQEKMSQLNDLNEQQAALRAAEEVAN